MNPAAIILTIEITVIIAVAITALVYAHRLELTDKRSGENECCEPAELGIGGAADFLSFHDAEITDAGA